MRTLIIDISEGELDQLGIRQERMRFTEFMELVRREFIRKHLEACVLLAEQYGLSSMSMDDSTRKQKRSGGMERHHLSNPSCNQSSQRDGIFVKTC